MKLFSMLMIILAVFVGQTECGFFDKIKAGIAKRRAARKAKIQAALEKCKEVAEKIGDALPITLIYDEEKIQEFVSDIIEKAGDISVGLQASAAKLKLQIVNKLKAFKAFVDKLLVLLPKVKAAVSEKIASLAAMLKAKLQEIYAKKVKLFGLMKIELTEWKEEAADKLAVFKAKLMIKKEELAEIIADKKEAVAEGLEELKDKLAARKEDCTEDIAALKVKISALTAEITEKVGTAIEVAKPYVIAALEKLGVMLEEGSETICDCIQDETEDVEEVICEASNYMIYAAIGIQAKNPVAVTVCDIRDNIAEAQEEVENFVIFENPEIWSQPVNQLEYKPNAVSINNEPDNHYYSVSINHMTLIIALLITSSCAAIGTVLYCKQKRQNAGFIETEYKM